MTQAQIAAFSRNATKRFFELRGNRSEAHLSRDELAAIIEAAILAYEELDADLRKRANEARYGT